MCVASEPGYAVDPALSPNGPVPEPSTPSRPRRIAAFVASHLLGVTAHAILSPVVVGYTMLLLGTLGFALVGGGINEEGGSARMLVEAFLARGGGEWIDFLWRENLSFEGNALRLFGGLGLIGWLLDLLVGLVRGRPPVDRPIGARAKRLFVGLAAFTALVCLALLAAVLSIDEWAGDPPFWQRVLQGGATTLAMGSILFIASAPAVLAWFGLREARGPVAAAIAARTVWAWWAGTEAEDPTGTAPEHARQATIPRLRTDDERPGAAVRDRATG